MRTPKTPIPEYLRQKVFKRDNYTCQYCGTQGVSLHADHVYPESKGGETTLGNLVAACGHCNYTKKDKVGVWPRKVIYTDVVVEKVVVKEVIVEKRVIVEVPRPEKPAPEWILTVSVVLTMAFCSILFVPFVRNHPWIDILNFSILIVPLLNVFEFGWIISQKYGR